MSLYLVVRHRLAKQVWNNAWRPGNDDLLDAITTSADIARLCDDARLRNEEVFIHRTGWGDAVICCAAHVESVRAIPDGDDSLVCFANVRAVLRPPPESRTQGDDCYESQPPRP